ncbi:polysaccharide pyruvyl transferase family protein [Rhodococcus sp. NPDC077669]|uniref:polysaccharide pyruvyl transferase family protein n=1 Tax=Rhodococcus sp. NPDC077669 TaxID=3155174 RepID=UPI0034226E33
MNTLILWGSQSSANLGVRVLGSGAAEVARLFGASDCEQYNFGDRGPGFEFGRKQLFCELLRPGPISQWLRQFDLVLDTGSGDSFADIYGLQRLEHIALLRKLAIRVGVTTVLTPQTIGPFNSIRGKIISKWSLRGVAAVMSRDEVSAATSKVLAPNVPSVSSTDLVFALPSVRKPVRKDGILLNVSGLLWNENPHVSHVGYRELTAGLIRECERRELKVSLLAHVHSEADSPDNDMVAINHLVANGFSGTVHVPNSLAEVRDIISSSQVVVGARMHACLNALSLGIPSLALAYSRKFEPLLSDIGWHHVIDLRVSNSVDEVFGELLVTMDSGVAAQRVENDARLKLTQSVESLIGSVLTGRS